MEKREKQGKDFFHMVRDILDKDSSQTEWCLISADIENLKLLNKLCGRKKGEEILSAIETSLQEKTSQKFISGYLGNDDFVLFMEDEQAQIEGVYEEIRRIIEYLSGRTGFLPSFGLYKVNDRGVSVFTMYDCAELARLYAKKKYSHRIARYDSGMMEALESHHQLLSDAKDALANHEFVFVLQPKCNMQNGRITGAEALVRWISKEKGVISPGSFIPEMEKNGFITELDLYIWEEVCKWQKTLLDRKINPVPVSVNVSKKDIYSLDLPAVFSNLTEKYSLSPHLIDVEITESAYTQDYQLVDGMVRRLRKAGFHVHMDDFGSGYSSLNMLKDMEVDVLKIDAKFMEINEDNEIKGRSIIEAIQNMASLMDIRVIAEGVETEEQKKFLLSIGCGTGQGFLFYRPLSVSDFEQIISNEENMDYTGYRRGGIEQHLLRDILGGDLLNESMINNILGPVAFFDVCDGRIELIRHNDQYTSMMGEGFNRTRYGNFQSDLFPESRKVLLKTFDDAKKDRYSGAEADLRMFRPKGKDIRIHLRVFFLRNHDGHDIFYGAANDITEFYRT